MTNLAGLGPLGLKQPRTANNPAYLAAVRGLPCIICREFGMTQRSRTEAHHVFHDRFEQRKTPDEMAIPLCTDHHRGDGFDPSKLAVHKAKDEWRLHYGADYDWTPRTQDALAHLLKGKRA